VPTDYGQGKLQISSHIAGTFRVSGFTAASALYPRLRIHLTVTLGDLQDFSLRDVGEVTSYRITNLSGELRADHLQKVVSVVCWPGAHQSLRSLSYSDSQETHLLADLDAERVERLEQYRAGGSLELWLQLWPRCETPSGVFLDSKVDCFIIRVPREDWLEVLVAFRKEYRVLLEVPMPRIVGELLPACAEEYRRAVDALDQGDYWASVVRCRKALDLMIGSLPGTNQKTKTRDFLSEIIDDSHAKIYDGIIASARRMGSEQVHSANARQYSRAEALFAIRVTASSLELLGSFMSGRLTTE